MKPHERRARSFFRSLAALTAAGLTLYPIMACAADPPSLPPASPAPAAASAVTVTAPSTAPAESVAPATKDDAPKPLPPSVLAMQGHNVVVRLKDDGLVEGYLASASVDVFEVLKPGGSVSRIPRANVRSVRLAETPMPKVISSTFGRPAPLAPSPGDSASPEDSEDSRPWKERSVGFGTAFGGGFSSMEGATSGAFLLPTVELQIFLPREYSVDVSLPVLNMALGSALIKGLLVGGDLYFNVNAGSGRTRFVTGPGIGFAYLDINHRSTTSVKIPMQIGFEVLSKRRTFGFKLLARPWFEIASGAVEGTGGGCLGVLMFSGYSLTPGG